MIVIFVVLLVLAFVHGNLEDMMKPGVAWTFVAILLIIFIIAGINVFGPAMQNYFAEATGPAIEAKNIFQNPSVLGALLLFAVAAVTAWVLGKK